MSHNYQQQKALRTESVWGLTHALKTTMITTTIPARPLNNAQIGGLLFVQIHNLHPPENRRLYNTLVLLIHMVHVIEPEATWPQRLLKHLLTLKPGLIPHMGFPPDWQQRPLWNELLAFP